MTKILDCAYRESDRSGLCSERHNPELMSDDDGIDWGDFDEDEDCDEDEDDDYDEDDDEDDDYEDDDYDEDEDDEWDDGGVDEFQVIKMGMKG